MLLARLTKTIIAIEKAEGPEAGVLYNESKFSLSLPVYRWKNHDNDSSRQGMREAESKEGCDGVLLIRSLHNSVVSKKVIMA